MDKIRMKANIKLSYPNFKEQWLLNELNGWSYAYHVAEESCETWFERMRDRIELSIKEKIFLPLYRMGDGEYNFLLGYRPMKYDFLNKLRSKKIINNIKKIFSRNIHSSGNLKDGIEKYTTLEIKNIKENYVNNLRYAAKKGIVTHAFDNGRNFARYYKPVTRFLESNKIEININNYFHGYHVYALFSSDVGYKLLERKKVLVISSLSNKEKNKLEEFLCEKNIAETKFINISKEKALLELMPKIDYEVDIVLIAGGVGSLNIMMQLEYLKCPCIDVGTIINCYSDQKRFYERPYMVSDNLFNINDIKYINEELKDRYKKFKNNKNEIF
jgi:hypothetical protein